MSEGSVKCDILEFRVESRESEQPRPGPPGRRKRRGHHHHQKGSSKTRCWRSAKRMYVHTRWVDSTTYRAHHLSCPSLPLLTV